VSPTVPPQPAPQSYAGFWRRVLASVLDWVVIGFPNFFVSLIAWRVLSGPHPTPMDPGVTFVQWIVASAFIAVFLGQWLYFALMESSSKQATVGKNILRIRVTDMSGNRISFGRASARYFAKYISSFTLLVGYLMAGFTQKNQALHDIIAETLVLRNE
jgi:uncharacterized RDD family membrane protein YckC